MMNAAIIFGRIATDPVVKDTSVGQKLTTFRIITNTYRSGKKHTTGHNIKAWGKGLATVFSESLAKGDAVGFIGRIENSSYEKDGVTFYSSAVVLDPNTEVARLDWDRPNND